MFTLIKNKTETTLLKPKAYPKKRNLYYIVFNQRRILLCHIYLQRGQLKIIFNISAYYLIDLSNTSHSFRLDSQQLNVINEAIVVFQAMLREARCIPIRCLGIFLFTLITTITMIVEKTAKVNYIS